MYRIGIDLGGTNIAAGLVNEEYKIVAKLSTPTITERGAEAIVDDIASLCKKICVENGIDISEIAAIGIASPGAIDSANGVVKYANNLPFSYLPITKMVSEKTGVVDVRVENDANAAAWGEAVAGAAKGATHSVMITLGTGVGGGVIIDGKIYSGFNGIAGELGHIVIEHDGKHCSCGRRGCWESYSSATGLINMTKEKLEECAREGRATVMTELVEKKGKVSGVTAFEAMRMGDAAGREVVDTYISYLACGLTNMVNIFQPEVISIGGGVSNEGQSLVEAVLPTIRKEQYGGNLPPLTDIRIAKLKNDAGIIGAALLSV
ncbi:MAG: ROK family protein [Ruminococcaceae bacterium]|nr:ROK family protein [Oscillospiraceae bacterium]